ncbi:MAG: penicillin-binding transpeptidase domain-containing protein [Desulfobacterales bacterium]|nr:penicillin-binding transpeptidase domain-containing protein [Desulfobacterales bacterium]
MFKRSKLNTRLYAPTHRWRNYQVKLHRRSAKEKAVRRLPIYFFALIVLIALTKGAFWVYDRAFIQPATSRAKPEEVSVKPLDQSDLQKLLASQPLTKLTRESFYLESGRGKYRMVTSVKPSLQQVITDHIDRKYAKYFGFVALDPESGEIQAMVSFDRTGENSNVCTRPDFPAASLIKIVTAGAAIEEYGFRPTTPVSFNGRKYTLYKSQLKTNEHRYTNHITFEDSFADSINPVFGKIGVHRLKKSGLEKYGRAFGFNQDINFDLPLAQSPLVVKDEVFNWAEIACGFNRQTLISPLHAAVLVAGVANEGRLMAPTLIQTVREKNQPVYKSQPQVLNQAVSADTANRLKRLMHATITEGTARKAFSARRRDKVLSRLDIGGKTGSINNNPLHIKYDWFAGFAEDPDGGKKLAVAVFVAHKEYIGTRAASYAKLAFQEYFKTPSTDSNL